MNKKTDLGDGIFVNVPELIDKCTRAYEITAASRDSELRDAAQSIMSALVLALGKRRAYMPEELREQYNLLMRKT